MYSIGKPRRVDDQIGALPAEALVPFAEAMVILETAPWSGRSLDSTNPNANIYTRSFGRRGLITYLILERQHEVELLDVTWTG